MSYSFGLLSCYPPVPCLGIFTFMQIRGDIVRTCEYHRENTRVWIMELGGYLHPQNHLHHCTAQQFCPLLVHVMGTPPLALLL